MQTIAGLTLGGLSLVHGKSRAAVLGGGVMGPGIALTLAEKGFLVDLCEINAQALDKGLHSLRESLNLKVEENLLSQADAIDILGRVSGHVGSEKAIAHADLVIDAVPENKDIKRGVYADVHRLAPPHCVIWSNTSTLNVFELVDPDMLPRIVVAHWFAPPHIIPLVEVVGDAEHGTSLVDETVDLLKTLGKAPVRLKKFVNGFVINRLQRLLGREIFFLLESGVISAEELDKAVRTSLAPRMQLLGVVQRYDFTGLNLSLRNLQDKEFVEPPFQSAPSCLTDLVYNGHLGVSTGKGFYDYGDKSTLEMQKERDRHLIRIIRSLGCYVDDPKPLI